MNLDSAIALLSQYGLWAIFLIIMLEYACFPISSELVLPVSGLVAFRLGHRITLVILISVCLLYTSETDPQAILAFQVHNVSIFRLSKLDCI